jgi:hypothetical protein
MNYDFAAYAAFADIIPNIVVHCPKRTRAGSVTKDAMRNDCSVTAKLDTTYKFIVGTWAAVRSKSTSTSLRDI